MLNTQLQNKLPEVIKVLKEHRVKRAYAFGSVCTDRFNSSSDIDLLIGFESTEPFDGYAENFWEMEEKLSALLNRKVDLVPEHTLKNPYFIKVMEKTKTPLYE
jgi:predicted nucleotidyltransferase